MAGDMSYEHRCRQRDFISRGEEKVEPRWLPPVGLSAFVTYIYIYTHTYTHIYIYTYLGLTW